MLQANQGRRVFADDGTFAFPPRVRRVWIDVGAHLLQTTVASSWTTRTSG